MKTNEYKEQLCKKYRSYLELIDKIGNKIMFQEQLIKLSIVLNISKDVYETIKVINELVNSEVIKKTRFGSKKTQILIFKKYAIRFLRGLSSSQSVGAVPKVTTNSRYWESYFKTEIIIEQYIPQMIKNKINPTLENLLQFIKIRNSTILLNKNKGGQFYENLMKQEEFSKFLNKYVLEEHIKVVKAEHSNMLKSLNKNKKNDNTTKRKKRKNKWDFLHFSTINTLTRRNVYVNSIEIDKNETIKIYCNFLDINNTQDLEKGLTNLAIVYNFFKRIFNKKIMVKLNMFEQTQIGQTNVYAQSKDNKGIKILKKLKLNELDFGNLTFTCEVLKNKLIEVEN